MTQSEKDQLHIWSVQQELDDPQKHAGMAALRDFLRGVEAERPISWNLTQASLQAAKAYNRGLGAYGGGLGASIQGMFP